MKITVIPNKIVPNRVRNFFKFVDSADFVSKTVAKQDTFKYSTKVIEDTLNSLQYQKPKFKKMLNPKVQRALDLSVATVISPFVLATLGIITALFKITNPKHHILLTQNRLGYMGKEFDIYKISTMEGVEQNKPQLSAFSKFLRKHSLDELPQYFNVLNGDMSFVGPRAIQRKTVNMLLNDNDLSAAERFFVKPGFGFGDQREKVDMHFRRQVEKQNLDNFGIATYLKTICNLVKNILLGRNK